SLTPPNKDIKHSQRKCFLGKRQGLRLLGGPWYVVEKDTKNNVVFVSRNYYSIDKRRRVRHRLGFFSCSFEMEADGDVEVVHLDEDDQGRNQLYRIRRYTGVMGRSVFPGLCKISSIRGYARQN
ncbi:unnamed protein product, partial [Brassica napus]